MTKLHDFFIHRMFKHRAGKRFHCGVAIKPMKTVNFPRLEKGEIL